MIVVDTSALVELLLQTDVGRRVEARVLATGEVVHAPHLLDVEAAQVLRKLVHRRDITEERAREALEDLGLMGVIRHPHIDLVPRAFELRENLTAYDAVYVALAEALDSPLVTCDESLSSHGTRIEWIG